MADFPYTEKVAPSAPKSWNFVEKLPVLDIYRKNNLPYPGFDEKVGHWSRIFTHMENMDSNEANLKKNGALASEKSVYAPGGRKTVETR